MSLYSYNLLTVRAACRHLQSASCRRAATEAWGLSSTQATLLLRSKPENLLRIIGLFPTLLFDVEFPTESTAVDELPVGARALVRDAFIAMAPQPEFRAFAMHRATPFTPYERERLLGLDFQIVFRDPRILTRPLSWLCGKPCDLWSLFTYVAPSMTSNPSLSPLPRDWIESAMSARFVAQLTGRRYADFLASRRLLGRHEAQNACAGPQLALLERDAFARFLVVWGARFVRWAQRLGLCSEQALVMVTNALERSPVIAAKKPAGFDIGRNIAYTLLSEDPTFFPNLTLCAKAAQQLQALTAWDRVMKPKILHGLWHSKAWAVPASVNPEDVEFLTELNTQLKTAKLTDLSRSLFLDAPC